MKTPQSGVVATGTQALDRSYDMLRVVASHREGLRLRDLQDLLGLESPTAHRIAQGLARLRLLSQDEVSKRYFLGPALYELGITASQRFPLNTLVQPSVERLTHETEDTVAVSIQSGLDSVCIEHQSGSFPIQTRTVTVGTRRALAAGAGGLAILANLEPAEAALIIPDNAVRMGIKPEELQARIAVARKQGYVFNEYTRTDPHISSVAMAFRGPWGRVVGAIAVVALGGRLTQRRAQAIQLLEEEVIAIQSRIDQFVREG